MEPENLNERKHELVKLIFASTLKGDKGTIKRCLKQTYADEEMLLKDNPDAPGGVSKVLRKTIKPCLTALGEILDDSGNSVIDILIAGDKFLTAVNFLQDEQLGLLQAFPRDVHRLYFNVRMKPENYFKLMVAAHEVLAAQDFQRRSFIRRICYGQPANAQVDEFIKEHYDVVHNEIMQFREKYQK